MHESAGPTAEPDDLDVLRREVRAIYADLARDVAEAGPVCDLSGRCCRFVEWDHTLFLSGIEAEILRADAPAPARPLDDGATCPWQDAAGRCTAREARPLGCRVYYCAPSYPERSHELSALYLGRLRHLADRLGRPWNYAPLHVHLRDGTDRRDHPTP
jgi:hypothetical protein